MQIFEPKLMAALIDTPYRYDFEILDQTLFIYAPRFISTQAELDSFYKYATLISRPIYNEIAAMHVSTAAAQPATKQLWSVGRGILNGLTLISLSVGVVGLAMAAIIAIYMPSNPVLPVLALTCVVIILIGAALLGFVQHFRR